MELIITLLIGVLLGWFVPGLIQVMIGIILLILTFSEEENAFAVLLGMILGNILYWLIH